MLGRLAVDERRWDRPFPRTGCSLNCRTNSSMTSLAGCSRIGPGLKEATGSAGRVQLTFRTPSFTHVLRAA